MKQVSLHIPHKNTPRLWSLQIALISIKKIDVDDAEPGKEKVLQHIKQAVKEVN